MPSFRKIQITMRSVGYGQYIITGTYKGKELTVRSTDSEAYDYLRDDTSKEKHQAAKRHCYNKLRFAYENQF